MKEQSFYAGVVLLIVYLFLEKRVPVHIRIIWGYFMLYAMFVAYSPRYYPAFAPQLQGLLAYNATRHLVQYVLFPIVVLASSSRMRGWFYKFIGVFILADMFKLLKGGAGLIEASTYDAGLIGCMLPIFVDKVLYKKDTQTKISWLNLAVIFAGIIAISFTKSRTGLLAILVTVLVYGWPYLKFLQKKYYYFAVFFISTMCLAASGLYFKFKLLHDPRLRIWAGEFDWWLSQANYWVGTGPGSFEFLGLFLKVDSTGAGGSGLDVRFYLLHNDWLQTLFETGAIGLALSILLYFSVLVKIKDISHRAMWLAMGSMGLMYYPIHSAFIQILALIIIRESFSSIPITDKDTLIKCLK